MRVAALAGTDDFLRHLAHLKSDSTELVHSGTEAEAEGPGYQRPGESPGVVMMIDVKLTAVVDDVEDEDIDANEARAPSYRAIPSVPRTRPPQVRLIRVQAQNYHGDWLYPCQEQNSAGTWGRYPQAAIGLSPAPHQPQIRTKNHHLVSCPVAEPGVGLDEFHIP